MNKFKVMACALIVCMSFASIAEAKSRGGSFKSGFSSQKRSAPKPSPAYNAPAPQQPAKKTAFGSFGATNPNAQQNATTVPQSQMSKDLNNTTLQSNAQKTADARNSVNEKNTASESGWFRSGNQNAATANTQTANTAAQNAERRSGNQQAAGQQTWQQNNARQSGGLMQGLMWFMVGHTVAQHLNAPQNNHAQNDQIQNGNHDAYWSNAQQGIQQNANGENNSINANGIATQQEQDIPAVETETFFMKLVRVVLWIALISGVIWVVRKVMSFRHRNLKATTHYSLGS